MDIFVFQVKGWDPSKETSRMWEPDRDDPRAVKRLFAFPSTNIKENLALLEEHFGEDFIANEFERILDVPVTLLGVTPAENEEDQADSARGSAVVEA